MNITLRMTAFVLFVFLSISAAACTAEQEDENAQTTAETTINTPASNPYADELPAIDGEGDTINICGWGYAEAAEELYTEELTGEVVNDAVFNRNLAVEQRLNIKMNIVLKMDGGNQYFVPNTVRTAVLAGDGAYDIMAGPTYSSAYFATENIFYDLRSLDYLDLDKSYWAQGYNEVMSVGGAQYICTGTPAISLYRFMYVTVYNNALFESYNLENLNDTVNSGKWTLDVQYKLAENLYDDLNGNGAYDKEDLFGFVGGARTSSDTYWVNCGVKMLDKDEDDYYLYNPDIRQLSDAVDKVLKLYYDCSGSYIIPHGEDGVRDTGIVTIFRESRAAMATMHLSAVETNLRDFKDEYSIVPMPKYNEEQESYKTYVQVELTAFAVTKTVSAERSDLMGAFLECLASESYRLVYPAYYETALSYKYLQNEDSVEMLRLIYESIYMDGSIIYTNELGGALIDLRNMMKTRTNTVASVIAALESNVNASVDKMNNLYRSLRG
ncbi:MAG: extracellular solute-binding protein [Eubacteriales bacterium]